MFDLSQTHGLCSLPGSSVCGILQARILEWIAIPFSRDLPNQGFEPGSPALQADPLLFELQEELEWGIQMISDDFKYAYVTL